MVQLLCSCENSIVWSETITAGDILVSQMLALIVNQKAKQSS